MDSKAHDLRHALEQKIIANKLLGLFAEEGYKEIAVPMVDKYNNYRTLMQAERNNRIPGKDDEPLLLRPDVTLFLTRSIANSLRAMEPKVRLCYAENVVRDLLHADGVGREQFHTGVELFGEGTSDEMEEIIFLAIRALEVLGLKGCQIHIGTRSLFDRVIPDHYMSSLSHHSKPMRKAVTDKLFFNDIPDAIVANNYYQLRALLEYFTEFEPNDCDALLALFAYRGSSESDADRLIEMFDYAPEKKNIVAKQLGRLHNLCDKLSDRIIKGKYQQKVIVDPSEIGQNGYYTDIAFSIYSPIASSRIAGGGRYDTLVERFADTDNKPACGFCFFQERFVNHFIVDTEVEIGKNSTPAKLSRTPEKPLTPAADLITIAIPKGRIFEKVKDVIEKNGGNLDFEGRSLIAEDIDLGIRWQLVKNVDVPTYVNNGKAALGIVGSDILGEYPDPIATLHTFKFGGARMVLITTEENSNTGLYNGVTIATKYPVTTQEYLDRKGIDGKIIKLNGSLELAPLLQLAPFIVDIVESGDTIRDNNLKKVDIFGTTKVLLAAKPAYYKLHAQRIKDKILPILAEN